MPFLTAKKRLNSEKTLNSDNYFQGCIQNAITRMTIRRISTHSHLTFVSMLFIFHSFLGRTRREGRRFRRLKRTIYQLTQSVIQTTVGRKNPGSIHVYVIEILRFALNDMTRVSTNILLPIKKVANHRLATFF